MSISNSKLKNNKGKNNQERYIAIFNVPDTRFTVQ